MAEGTAFGLAALASSSLIAARSRVTAAEVDSSVLSYYEILNCEKASPDEPELATFERFALMGVSAGFVERNLSPHLPEHTAIIQPLLEEIRSVYGQLIQQGLTFDPEEFRLRAFHYGLHKASYLDWTLYLSKECY